MPGIQIGEKVNSDTGLTKTEKEILDSTVELWNKFLDLRQTHDSDIKEVLEAIHKIQYIIGMRSLRRLYPEQYYNMNRR